MTNYIKNLSDLCDFFSADEPSSLNRRLYKDTDCGASISLYFHTGMIIHNGQDPDIWNNLQRDALSVRGFSIQTIVEGSDATVDSAEFVFPVSESVVSEWIQYMEKTAHDLWMEANEDGEDETIIDEFALARKFDLIPDNKEHIDSQFNEYIQTEINENFTAEFVEGDLLIRRSSGEGDPEFYKFVFPFEFSELKQYLEKIESRFDPAEENPRWEKL